MDLGLGLSKRNGTSKAASLVGTRHAIDEINPQMGWQQRTMFVENCTQGWHLHLDQVAHVGVPMPSPSGCAGAVGSVTDPPLLMGPPVAPDTSGSSMGFPVALHVRSGQAPLCHKRATTRTPRGPPHSDIAYFQPGNLFPPQFPRLSPKGHVTPSLQGRKRRSKERPEVHPPHHQPRNPGEATKLTANPAPQKTTYVRAETSTDAASRPSHPPR
eukprot:COSAG05_NODE_10_length_39559_cov_64.255423_15_plen_214_part_00